MKSFVADFETTTDPDNCRVWAFAICEVGNEENVIIGTTIEEFINWCKNTKENVKIFFHNLKFDSQFLMHYLFKHGYKHITDPEDRADNTFSTLISDKGLYYQIEVVFKLKGKKVNKVIFQDSLKLIPLSVSEIAKAFKMDIGKLEIDYTSHDNLPEGAELTEEEKEYIIHDVKIVARAIEYFYSQGLTKMTIGSCALDEYKKLITNRSFKKFYPTPKYHEDVKASYRGGFTYLQPQFSGKNLDKGLVFDVNSLYPSVMRYEYLPYSQPIYYKGKYTKDPIYPLYVQRLRCQFQLKKGKIPTIQIKSGYNFIANEYLTNSGDSEVVLTLTSVDLELFYEQYDVFNEEWIGGWKFKATQGLFNDYIDKWSTNKIQAKKDKNHGLYLISKLFLNSLYGKFGSDVMVRSKVPYLGEDDIIHFHDSDPEYRDGIYIAMASFITSYARLKTISAFQKVTDNYNLGLSKAQSVYADTDSLHIWLNGEDEKTFLETCGLDIDPTKLGAWKFESKWSDKGQAKGCGAKFLRQKCYIENSTEDIENPDPEYELKVTVAGMPKSCYDYVNFKNFKIGASFGGKKQPKRVKGGVILSEVEFTIKDLDIDKKKK